MLTAQRTRWKLKPLHIPGLDPVDMGDGAITLGRAPSNTISLPADDHPQVSAHHVRLTVTGGELAIEDLGSTNGTFVNGKKAGSGQLRSGDTIQLGARGPRFVVLDVSAIEGAVSGAANGGSLGATKFVKVPAVRVPKSVLRNREALWGLLGLVLIVAICGGIAFFHLEQRGFEESARVDRMTSVIQDRIEQKLTVANLRLDEQSALWSEQRASLESERDRLKARIADVEGARGASPSELASLQASLQETIAQLELYDPLGAERARLEGVSHVRKAVVLIEKTVVYRDQKTGRLLYFDKDHDSDPLNIEGRGTPLTLDSSTGSGFCISPEGWVITNAHVLSFTEAEVPLPISEDLDLRPERRLEVVFSDDSARHLAEVIRVEDDPTRDLALLKIESFEGIPYLVESDIRQDVPAPGAEVYLFGFPLGHHALQDGDTVIASTFKGILSRVVSPFIQIDAGVYPGNSGGPLTDASGRVIGVIFSVQNNLDGTTAANIGYAIPVDEIQRLWPLPVRAVEAKSPEVAARH